MDSSWFKRLKSFINRRGPWLLNIFSPMWFLIAILGVNILAADHALDLIYGSSTTVSWCMQVLAWFMTSEMLIHWFCIWFVSPEYVNTTENNNVRLEHENAHPEFQSKGINYSELLQTKDKLNTQNWSVITEYKGADVIRTAYPYWSWKPCLKCSHCKPPRCHHCPICGHCVLKRDHHCFFARTCVGLQNQRYFVVFNFWAVLALSLALPQLIAFIYLSAWDNISWFETFLPLTFLSWLIGSTSAYTLFLIFECWSLFWFLPLAGYFLWEQFLCIEKGMTSFELDSKETVILTVHKSKRERFEAVFGKYPLWLNLFIPMHMFSKPSDDGITWTSVKME